jgi:rod shape-determining protein MreB
LALERTPPELAADIMERGIVLRRRRASENIDILLRDETGVPVMRAEDPLACVVLGCGKALDNMELLLG